MGLQDQMADDANTKRVRRGFVRKRTLKTSLQQVSEQMYARNKELAETNQTLSLLQTINSLALDPGTSLASLCGQVVGSIAEVAGFPVVGILTTATGQVSDLELHGISLAGDKDWEAAFGERRRFTIDVASAHWPEGLRSQVLPLASLSNERLARMLGCHPEVVRGLRKKLKLRTLYILQMTARGRLVGFLFAGLFEAPEQVRPQDITLLDRLGEPVGVALDNRLLFEENQQVLRQLTRTNEKLKALDETKDEFITMASHQLRTPLTSVKGYLSMVLEGDAGKLNANQTKLLQQSFISSQRMVYLISDLLNLSRINTGRFVIETTPVDLSELVQSEIDQLAETAKSRDLRLVYKKPATFPELMLDETKTHQVVMNLIDNAIYYTPAGGKVTVELRDTPNAVEYLVHDTGIGVPKAVRHKLFTKFYRAANAQQARPDGTGLGLFMARKVIVAQGGAIIFDSVEGKGSTFGFRFNKAGHLPPKAPKPKT